MSDKHDRDTLKRARYLARTAGLNEQQSLALAYREQGFSTSGIASEIGSTEGTVRSYMRRIAAQYGLEAIWTKTEDERTDLEEVTPERLDELSDEVRKDWREQASHFPEHVPEAVRNEVVVE